MHRDTGGGPMTLHKPSCSLEQHPPVQRHHEYSPRVPSSSLPFAVFPRQPCSQPRLMQSAGPVFLYPPSIIKKSISIRVLRKYAPPSPMVRRRRPVFPVPDSTGCATGTDTTRIMSTLGHCPVRELAIVNLPMANKLHYSCAGTMWAAFPAFPAGVGGADRINATCNV